MTAVTRPEAARAGETAYRITSALVPWIAPLALLFWGWRARDLFHQVTAFGDSLEMMWGIRWFGDRLLSGQDVTYFGGIFHPLGWQVGTFANSPALLILLLPLYKMGGAAFALNLATLAALLLGYAGMFVLARRIGFDRLRATLVAVLFGFCYMRWIRVGGHLNQLAGSSLMPWLFWSLERAWADRPRFMRWSAAAGAIWGAAAVVSFYFVWIGALLVVGYTLTKVLLERQMWQRALVGLIMAGGIMLALSAPVLWFYFRAARLADVAVTDIAWISEWGVSLNALVAPSPAHPFMWMRRLFALIYRGPLGEATTVTFGLLASALAIVGLWSVRRDRGWWPILVVTGLGLLFALGYVLRRNGRPVELPLFQGVDALIWRVGRRIKPELFATAAPYGPYIQGAPLPGLLLAAFVPFWEGARVLARFAFISLPGFYLLTGKGVERFRLPAIQVALAALLLVEFLPLPTAAYTADPAPHPVFAWLRANTPAGAGIVDLLPAQGDRLELMFSGEVLWATQYHQRSTAAGASSVWPGHTARLRAWFIEHAQPWRDPGLPATLREYQVEYILLHMKGAAAASALEQMRTAPSLDYVDCFDRAKAVTAWPYKICLFRVRETG